MQRIKMPVSSGNHRSRKAPTQKGDGLKLAGEGLKLAGEGIKLAGGGVFDFLKSIASWLFGARSSKGKAEAEAEPEIKETLKTCKDILAEHGITDMKSWRRWALKNHPDKGGHTELFARVSDCVDKNIKGSGIYDRLLRLLRKANVKGLDMLFPGEMHAPQLTDQGIVIGNFIGPGTQIKRRIQRRDQPVSGMDTLAKRHDIAYSLAASPADIRKADEVMIADIDRVPDKAINKAIAKAGLTAKYKAESRTGVLFPSSAELRKNDPLDQLLLEEYGRADTAVRQMIGSGLNLAGGGVFDAFNRLAAKYGKIASDLGITPEMAKSSALKASRAVAEALEKKGAPPAVIKAVRAGIKQAGGGFWDSLLSVVSVLPIPFVSDVARVVSIANTAVKTATGSHTPALSGAVTGLMDAAKGIPVLGEVAKAAKPLAEMVGFGKDSVLGKDVDPAAAVKMAGDYIRDAISLLPKEAHEKLGPQLKELSSAAKVASTVGKQIKGSGYCCMGAVAKGAAAKGAMKKN